MHTQNSVLTSRLTLSIEKNDVDYSLSRLGGMRHADDNPLGVEIRKFGAATAFRIEAWPDFWYGNRVLGVDHSSEAHLEEIIDFFERLHLSFRFEIIPGMINRKLASRLHGLGFCQVSFNTALFRLPKANLKGAGKSFVVKEALPDEWDLFLDIYQDGFELPRLNLNERKAVRSWLENDRSRLYLCIARLSDKPAGVGILFVNEGIGLLADATTLPEFRGKGCHAAMIHDRINQSRKRGCDLLTSFVEFNSPSHTNLEKAGLRVAYTKSMWYLAE